MDHLCIFYLGFIIVKIPGHNVDGECYHVKALRHNSYGFLIISVVLYFTFGIKDGGLIVF